MTAPRRVITGLDTDARWTIATDGDAPTTPAPFPYWLVWASDSPVPGQASQTAETSLFPPPGGVRMAIGEIAAPSEEQAMEFSPEAGAYMGAGNRMHDLNFETGAHRSDTIDMMFVMSGSIDVVIGDESPCALHAGDALVLTGAQHFFRNNGTVPARYGIVMYGTETAEDDAEPRTTD